MQPFFLFVSLALLDLGLSLGTEACLRILEGNVGLGHSTPRNPQHCANKLVSMDPPGELARRTSSGYAHVSPGTVSNQRTHALT